MVSFLICLLATISTSSGLMCYQCGGGSKDDVCRTGYKQFQKTARLIADYRKRKTSDSSHPPYIPLYEECQPNTNKTMCMIEEVRSGAQIRSYIRGCSDGATFSFDLKPLHGLRPNNFTTCAYKTTGYQTCVTLCNSTDFCNGPSKAAPTICASYVLLLVALMYVGNFL